jgi:hypothetical protein
VDNSLPITTIKIILNRLFFLIICLFTIINYNCSVLLHNFHIFRNRINPIILNTLIIPLNKLHINIRTICLITRNIFYSIVLSVLNYLELSHLHAYSNVFLSPFCKTSRFIDSAFMFNETAL